MPCSFLFLFLEQLIIFKQKTFETLMKNLILTILFCFSINAFAQSNPPIKETLQKIKAQSKIDPDDKVVFNLLDEFYQKSLQAETDEMTPETIQKIQKIASDPSTKNLHILMLLLIYQQYISQKIMAKKVPDPKFQIEVITLLENEVKDVYGKIPAIVYIFKAEALDNDQKKEEVKTTVANGLKEYPDSVPLKVYSYLNTKDEALKNDLIKNHANHWMVQQFDIK